ncbi:MAG: hypothetical protein N2049_10215 [Anaerolineales bacterium]|nr:hypothetical protein [Anaerolineales bacterium]
MSLDRPTRFVIAWAFAASEDEAAPAVVRPTRQRTRRQAGVPWISDGRAIYRQEVYRVYRDPQRTGKPGRPQLVPTPGVGLSQAVKQRCHGRVVGVEVRQVLGPPIACPYAVHNERLNGVLRDRLNCLTRKTHAFAKDERTWDAAVTLCLFETNWLRPHPALRELADNLPHGRRYRQRTPAMAMGLTDHIWSWEEFLTFRHYHYSKE